MITTDHIPRDISAGFVFGSDPESCDIVVPPGPGPGRRYFSVEVLDRPFALTGKNHDREHAIVQRRRPGHDEEETEFLGAGESRPLYPAQVNTVMFGDFGTEVRIELPLRPDGHGGKTRKEWSVYQDGLRRAVTARRPSPTPAGPVTVCSSSSTTTPSGAGGPMVLYMRNSNTTTGVLWAVKEYKSKPLAAYLSAHATVASTVEHVSRVSSFSASENKNQGDQD